MTIKYIIPFYIIGIFSAHAACPDNGTCPGVNNQFFSCNSGFYKSGMATCLTCPLNKSSDPGSTEMTQCYSTKAGDTFSDETGDGIFTETCYFSTDWPTGISVVLIDNTGSDKSNLIKEINNITGIGLVAAKNLVDSVTDKISQTVVDNVSVSAAAEIGSRLEALGATVTIYQKGTYGVYLTGATVSNLTIIKEISERCGTSLSNAKSLFEETSESNPLEIISGVSYQYAEQIKQLWESLGATCIIN